MFIRCDLILEKDSIHSFVILRKQAENYAKDPCSLNLCFCFAPSDLKDGRTSENTYPFACCLKWVSPDMGKGDKCPYTTPCSLLLSVDVFLSLLNLLATDVLSKYAQDGTCVGR